MSEEKMTFLEFCEKYNGRPLLDWQKNFIQIIQNAMENKSSGFVVFGRKNGRTKALSTVIDLYDQWREENESRHEKA